jgi:carbon monoxide dehydrogenase subunit G
MAEIKQSFTVGHPRNVVWNMFQDLPKVVSCIPGASLSEPPANGEAKGRISVKLGPVKADFLGEAKITSNPADYTGTISGTGIDKKQNSRAKGVVNYRLIEQDGGARTQVDVGVEYTLSGTLAQFARGGIVDAVAGQIIQDFTNNLESELDASTEPDPASSLSVEALASGVTGGNSQPKSPGERSEAKPRELNLLSVLWTLLRGKLKGVFGRTQHRG